MPAIWQTQQWPQNWKRSVFIPFPKRGNARKHSSYHTIALISHASKIMFKILQARLQQYANHELPNVTHVAQVWEKAEIKWPTSLDHRKSKRIPEKHLLHWLCQSPCVDQKQLWKILKEMGIPDTWPATWESCMQVKKQQFEPNMEQWTGSKLG